MSQRLISTRKHPVTGEDVKPLWFDQSGRAFYPIMGAAPEDEGTDDGNGEGDESGDDGTEGQESGNGSSAKVSAEEFEKIKTRMQAADRRASAAEQKIKEFEDKGKDEITKATERVAELETSLKERDEEIKTLRLQTAFLSSNDVTWHDPEIALAHADLEGVIGEDGSIDKKALKKALEDLSKSRPFLVKQKDESEQQDPPPPSGIPAGSGRKQDRKQVDDDALRRKYPALYA